MSPNPEALARMAEQTIPADQVPTCPGCGHRVWLDRTCYRCGGPMPEPEGQT